MSYSYPSTPSEYYGSNNNEGSNPNNSSNKENNNSRRGPTPNNMKNTKPVGKGTYGLILQPALPNLKANGTTENFPDMVTKLYFRNNSLKEAIESGKKIYELTGNEGHKVSEYTYKYKPRNIDNSLKDKLLSNVEVNIDNIYDQFKPIPMIRMKNLGIDMRHDNLKTAIGKLSEIPATTLLEQVLKVMKQIEIFVTTNYIHGDVRPPNMMINPDTGVITIIDFDLFEPVPAFMNNNVGFYNRPPENYISDFLLYLPDILYITDFNLFKTTIEQNDKYKGRYTLDHYIINNNKHIHRIDDQLTKDKLIEILYHNTKYFVDKYLVGKGHAIDTTPPDTIRAEWAKMILPYFDAFGLASSLLELITTVGYKDPAIISLRDNVLWKMVAWKIDERIDIFEAVKRVEAIIATAAEKPKEAASSINNAVEAAVAAAKAALAAKKATAAAPAKSPYANAVAAAKAALAAAAGKVGGGLARRRKTVRRGKKHKRHSTRFISRR
jgi:serine/threonine protein kinase